MTQARDVGAGLVHLFEAALSGYVKSQSPNRGSVASNEVKDRRINIRETARQLEIWTVAGCNHRMARPNRPRNSLFVIADKGKLITSYDKRYCSHSDITDWYSAGHHANIFSVDGFRIDCALCIEIQFPEVFRQCEQLYVDCVCFLLSVMTQCSGRKHRVMLAPTIYGAVSSRPLNLAPLCKVGLLARMDMV